MVLYYSFKHMLAGVILGLVGAGVILSLLALFLGSWIVQPIAVFTLVMIIAMKFVSYIEKKNKAKTLKKKGD